MRHTSLALAIALQLGSFAALAETAAVPSLPTTPATAATQPSVAPTTAVTPTTSTAPVTTTVTPAVTTVKPAAAPEAKPVAVKTEAAPTVVKEAAPAAKAAEAMAKQPCPGNPLMTPEERAAHREKMRTLDPGERQAYMAEHRAMMQSRMREAMGITGEANPPPDFALPNPLMSPEERDAHREKLRTLTGKEREAYLDEHYAKLRERAQKIAEMDDNAPPMPDFDAQRQRITEMRDALRREMEDYRAKMREFGDWGGGPEMGRTQPWGPGPQGWGMGPQQGWRQPVPGYGPGPWGGVPPEGGYQSPYPR